MESALVLSVAAETALAALALAQRRWLRLSTASSMELANARRALLCLQRDADHELAMCGDYSNPDEST